MTRSQSSGDSLRNGRQRKMPALLTSTSTGPSSRSVARDAVLGDPGAVMSAARTSSGLRRRNEDPRPFPRARRPCARPGRRGRPPRRSAGAIERPMPRPAPVTRTVRSWKSHSATSPFRAPRRAHRRRAVRRPAGEGRPGQERHVAFGRRPGRSMRTCWTGSGKSRRSGSALADAAAPGAGLDRRGQPAVQIQERRRSRRTRLNAVRLRPGRRPRAVGRVGAHLAERQEGDARKSFGVGGQERQDEPPAPPESFAGERRLGGPGASARDPARLQCRSAPAAYARPETARAHRRDGRAAPSGCWPLGLLAASPGGCAGARRVRADRDGSRPRCPRPHEVLVVTPPSYERARAAVPRPLLPPRRLRRRQDAGAARRGRGRARSACGRGGCRSSSSSRRTDRAAGSRTRTTASAASRSSSSADLPRWMEARYRVLAGTGRARHHRHLDGRLRGGQDRADASRSLRLGLGALRRDHPVRLGGAERYSWVARYTLKRVFGDSKENNSLDANDAWHDLWGRCFDAPPFAVRCGPEPRTSTDSTASPRSTASS